MSADTPPRNPSRRCARTRLADHSLTDAGDRSLILAELNRLLATAGANETVWAPEPTVRF